MPGVKTKGGRPSRFTPEIGAEILVLLEQGISRKEAAARCGIGVRTLQEWLQRGRNCERALSGWARRLDEATAQRRRERVWATAERNDVQKKERWQRFMASREAWWLKQLGPERFWTRRLVWLLEKGNDDAFRQTLAQLRSEGFRIFLTP